MDLIKRYGKAFAAVAVAVATAVASAMTDSMVTDQEMVLIASVLVGAVGVSLVPNLDAGIAGYAKGVVAFLTAGLGVLSTVMLGGLTPAEMIEVLVAALAAVGVVVGVPNAVERAARPGGSATFH